MHMSNPQPLSTYNGSISISNEENTAKLLNKLAVENQGLKREIEAKNHRISILKEDKADLTNEIVQLRVELKEKSNSINNKDEQLTRYENMVVDVNKVLNTHLNEWESKFSKLTSEINQSAKEFEKIQISKHDAANKQILDRLSNVENSKIEQETLQNSLSAKINNQKNQILKEQKVFEKKIQKELNETKKNLQKESKNFAELSKKTFAEVSNQIGNVVLKKTKKETATFFDEIKIKLEQIKSEAETNLELKLKEIARESSDEVISRVEDLDCRVSHEFLNTLKQIDVVSILGSLYDTWKYYPNDAQGHGYLVHAVIQNGTSLKKFKALLRVINEGALEWKHPESKLNALQLAWTIQNAEKFVDAIIESSSPEFEKDSLVEMLGDYANRIEELDDLEGHGRLLMDAQQNLKSERVIQVIRSRLRADASEWIKEFETLKDWWSLIDGALKSKDVMVRADVLFSAKSKFVNDDVFRLLLEKLGDDAARHMYDNIHFLYYESSVFDLTEAYTTIHGGFGDNQWHGAILNYEISRGVIEWEIYIGAFENSSSAYFGITDHHPCSNFHNASDDKIILNLSDGDKRIRGSWYAFADLQFQAGMSVRFILNMNMGNLSVTVDGMHIGIIERGLVNKSWWPIVGFVDESDVNPFSCTLTAFEISS
eukprot:TRINITY_DN1902_c0_g1_i1.p1 TRINITY_DN1902_c0_g1~~TRINITY_DN1902_c0_g1_i1.p1  ORF type:complete len:657 (-),score=172.67 TRINITY_DN1902_c0_g1_i1:12-1982(-)